MLRRIQRKQQRRERRKKNQFRTKTISFILLTVAVVGVLAMNRGCSAEGPGGGRALDSVFQGN